MNAEERRIAAKYQVESDVIEIDATTLPGLSIGSDKAVDFLHVMNSMEARQDLEAELWRQKSSSKSEQKIAILDTLIQFELQEPSPLLDCMNYPFASNVILIWLDERIVDRPMPASIVKNLRRLVDTGHIQINFNREHANAAIGMGITARGAAYLNTQTNRGELGHVEEVDVLRLLVTGSLRKTMIGGANIGNLQTQWNIQGDRLDAAFAGVGPYETAWLKPNKEAGGQSTAAALTEAIVAQDVETAWSFLSTSSRESIIRELLLQEMDLAPAILDTVIESYNKDIGPRSKAPALRRVIAKLVKHIEATKENAEEYLHEYILRCAALQLRSTMDWHINLRLQVQSNHQKDNPNPLLDPYQVAQLFIDTAVNGFQRLNKAQSLMEGMEGSGLNYEDVQEAFLSHYGDEPKYVLAKYAKQVSDGCKGFTEAAINIGQLPAGTDPKEAFIYAEVLGYTEGEFATVDLVTPVTD
jgi:hypothetical protein